MLKVVGLWVAQEGLILPDLESFLLPEAGKLLYYHRHSQSRLPVPFKSPDELLPLTRPTYAVEDYMPAKLSFYAEWLARWLACCLPLERNCKTRCFARSRSGLDHIGGSYTDRTCLRLVTSAAGATWINLSWR
jgi:hypothetical protein